VRIATSVERVATGISSAVTYLSEIAAALNRAEESSLHWTAAAFSLSDVAGLDAEVRTQVDEILQIYQDRERFARLGARIPRGILLVGPSGVGKTMLAHAIARELGHRICCVPGPILLGLGARGVRQLFEKAREFAPCIVFLDELEVACPSRSRPRLSGLDTVAHGLTLQLMTELEDLKEVPILVIAASNREELLEPALLRVGRLERLVHLDLPSASQRWEILKVHSSGKSLSAEIDLKEVAFSTLQAIGTAGFSGSDLAELLNEAAVCAAARRATAIESADLKIAAARVRQLVLRRSSNEQDGLGRTLARFHDSPTRTLFRDVGGMHSAIDKLQLLVDFLRRPETYFEVDCRVPRGVLLSGPPGTGKTLLARAVAGEAGVPFFFASGAEFIEIYVGVGAARVRDLLRIARRQSPSIVFIDELDALCAARAGAGHDGSREQGQALNQLLVELDGFRRAEAVVVIGATNRADILDPALCRPGRLEYPVEVGLPNPDERREILRIYLRPTDQLGDEDIERVVRLTEGRAGADLEALMNIARIRAVRQERGAGVRWRDVEQAWDDMARDKKARRLRHFDGSA
jgi:ATP-dependent Zn protease